jgi:hypothetical protein
MTSASRGKSKKMKIDAERALAAATSRGGSLSTPYFDKSKWEIMYPLFVEEGIVDSSEHVNGKDAWYFVCVLWLSWFLFRPRCVVRLHACVCILFCFRLFSSYASVFLTFECLLIHLRWVALVWAFVCSLVCTPPLCGLLFCVRGLATHLFLILWIICLYASMFVCWIVRILG